MKVLVCGGRDYIDYDRVDQVLSAIHEVAPISKIINGDARGADRLSTRWADEHNRVETWLFPADWRRHGKAAGPIRNQGMLDRTTPDLVIAFPGGHGTRDMVERAMRAGVRTLRIDWE